MLERLGNIQPLLTAIQPYKSNVEARPRLHWYPTGDFISLPLHAAGIYDGPKDARVSCSDYVVSSYTPTLTTLLRAQKANRPLRKEASRVALLAEKKAQEPHLQVLHEVEVEVEKMAAVARLKGVEQVERLLGPVTVLQASMAMQDANIVHLACHGIQDGSNALNSGFCLRDGRLKISELMNLKLKNPFLAFLSACETAKGDKNQPDQVLHLAAAMMFIGFKTVVATMW
jgi:CHAT domain-containing protein